MKSHNKKGGRKTLKTSLSKLSNKKLNKLAKQGKLRNKTHRRKLLGLLKERLPESNHYQQHKKEIAEDIPLEEADYSYYANSDRSLAFLSNIADGNDNIESKYESSRQPVKPSKLKHLLPIKTKDGNIVSQAMELDESTVNESVLDETISSEGKAVSDSGENEMTADVDVKPATEKLSAVEQFVRNRELITERKDKIAALATAVTADPQQNMGKLRELVDMLGEEEAGIRPVVMKLVTVSLAEVFKDIIPDYRIRLQTEIEEQQQMKKETKQLRMFETSLLGHYKRYLEYLEHCVKGKTPQKRNKKTGVMIQLEVPRATIKALQVLAARCLCELLVTQPHFNFRTNIVAVIVPVMNHSNREMSVLVCDYVQRLFKEDRAGEVTLEVVRLIGRLVKSSGFKVKNYVLDTLLSLRLHAVAKDSENDSKKDQQPNANNKFMSKSQRKYKKQMAYLEKELTDAAAFENKKTKNKIQSELISTVFLTYFRVLKQARSSTLLSSVLAGLSKFAHLINVEFFDDLFAVLREIVQSDHTTRNADALHCIQAAMTVLSGPQGSTLNIDPLMFYNRLYKTLALSFSPSVSQSEISQMLDCLDLMFSKRRKQITVSRLLAFAKRLSSSSVHQTSPGSLLAMLAMLRVLYGLHPKMAVLFEAEEVSGSGLYLPEVDDPDHCSAHNTAVFELTALRVHYHPVVRQYSQHLLAQCPIQGHFQLPAHLLHKSANDMFEFDAPEKIFDSSVPQTIAPSVAKRLESSQDKDADSSLVALASDQSDVDSIDFLSGLASRASGSCRRQEA